MIFIDADTFSTQAWLKEIINEIDDLPMDEIGRILVEGVQKHIDQAEGTMEPRKDKKGSWPLLKKTGTLYNSFESYRSGKDEVEASSDSEYGGFLQEGTEFIPVRNFFNIDSDSEDRIMELVHQHLNK